MTIQELIQQLSKLPQDLQVETRLDYADSQCCTYVVHITTVEPPDNTIEVLGGNMEDVL